MGDIWRVMRVRMVTGSLRRDYIHNQTLDIIESRGGKIAKALIEASERLNKNPRIPGKSVLFHFYIQPGARIRQVTRKSIVPALMRLMFWWENKPPNKQVTNRC